MQRLERLRDKANSLPLSPGVYIMKNADGSVIYVGKSKKLKNRVTSYFSSNHHSYKTAKMVSLVEDFVKREWQLSLRPIRWTNL